MLRKQIVLCLTRNTASLCSADLSTALSSHLNIAVLSTFCRVEVIFNMMDLLGRLEALLILLCLCSTEKRLIF